MKIRKKLNRYVSSLVFLVIATCAVAAGSLATVERHAARLADKWVGGERLLGEMLDQLTEFRLYEAYTAYARDEVTRRTAKRLAEGHAETIDAELEAYREIARADQSLEIEAFANSWRMYKEAHDKWINDPSMDSHPLEFERHLGNLYETTDLAADQIVALNSESASRDVRSIKRVSHFIEAIVYVLSFAIVAIGIAMFIRVKRDITDPLRSMTEALSRLARGDRDQRVPFVDREDEIGEMAIAFDTFRLTSLALERAHEETRVAQEEASILARRDPLTGLANRRVLACELDEALVRAAESGATYMVVVLDLDRFKPINDIQGHATGDLVLCEVGRRLTAATRRGDVVARLGGDEFAIISRTSRDSYYDDAVKLARRVLAEITKPIEFGRSVLEIGASVGIAACPWDGTDSDSLLRAADIAMYRAKRDHHSGFCLFESSMGDELKAQASLEADVREAIMNNRITPHYQPLIEMRNGAIYGFEILSRWNHPERGFVGPDIFVPIAERLGIVASLTFSVLRQACRDAVLWPQSTRLSLNVSPIQLGDDELVPQVLAILNEYDIDPNRLEIEITETAILSDLRAAKAVVSEFQSHGVKVSLDDFGTGYSSLYHLRELKIDKVKIDKSFVLSMHSNVESEKIVTAILGLARSLGIPTVAEGIEDCASKSFLRANGCDLGQGYLFGRAMDSSRAASFIQDANSLIDIDATDTTVGEANAT